MNLLPLNETMPSASRVGWRKCRLFLVAARRRYWLVAILASLMPLVLIAIPWVYSQESQKQAAIDLNKDFPILGKRLGSQSPANFVIAIDRSGSMKQFWPAVREGVISFVDAIPDGDYLSIIAFGTGASNLVTPRPINGQTRADLADEIRHLGEPTDSSTDIGAGVEKVLDELNVSTGNRLKFVFLFTDFAHEPSPQSKYYGKLSPKDDVWQKLVQRRLNEQSDSALQVFALLLPVSGAVGRDIQLGQAVFPELQPVHVNQATLLPWFERRKAEIARDKLKAIVSRDLLVPPIRLRTVVQSGASLVATFEIQRERIVDTVSLSELEISAFENVDIPVEITAATKSGKSYVMDSNNPTFSIEIPVANVVGGNSVFRWNKHGRITFVLKGKQNVNPSGEITKLNLPAESRFEIQVKEIPATVGGGYLPIWLGVLIGAIVLLLVAVRIYSRRTLYLIGSIAVAGVPAPAELTKGDKCRVFEIGRATSNSRFKTTISGVSWTLFIAALNPPEKPRGVYAKVINERASYTQIGKEKKEVPLTQGDWKRIPNRTEIQVGTLVGGKSVNIHLKN